MVKEEFNWEKPDREGYIEWCKQRHQQMKGTTKQIKVYTKNKPLEEGMMVHTTTSKFRFDNLRGNFDEEVKFKGEVIGEWVGANYDNYELGRHETAGKYGYDFWIVKKVLREVE